MKQAIYFSCLIILLGFSGCQSDSDDIIDNQDNQSENITNETSSPNMRKCASHDVLLEQIKKDPNLAVKMRQIEEFTQKEIKTGFESKLVNRIIEIPVVVNVLYRTYSENLSVSQIKSQINVLNADFNAANADFNLVPYLFANVKANVGIRFVLVEIKRRQTRRRYWGTNDAMKMSRYGGIDPTSPSTRLNIWSCKIGGRTLGYAQFPGGRLSTDGVVIDSNHFGLSSYWSYPYNLGRVGTHEVGHWLNLRHIWGDAYCGNDYCNDTPPHDGPNSGLPRFPHYSNCYGYPVEMTMNYMDYTDDRGSFMFTQDQKRRMLSTFQYGGFRYSFR